MKWSRENLVKWGWISLALFIFGLILAVYNFLSVSIHVYHGYYQFNYINMVI